MSKQIFTEIPKVLNYKREQTFTRIGEGVLSFFESVNSSNCILGNNDKINGCRETSSEPVFDQFLYLWKINSVFLEVQYNSPWIILNLTQAFSYRIVYSFSRCWLFCVMSIRLSP